MKYPIQPLLDATGLTWVKIVRELSIGGNEYRKYRDEGVTERVADRLASRLGLSAYNVWPEMLDHSITSCERVCALDECTERFVPSTHNHRYHDPKCRQRAKNIARRVERAAWARRRRQLDPAVAERNRVRRRAYYRENGEYERSRQRRYEAARRAERTAA